MSAERVAADTAGLAAAVSLLRAGQVIGMPTETVYGLAGDARNVEAVARIFAVKDRPTFDPLIVHVGHRELARLESDQLVTFAGDGRAIRERAEKLVAALWPGPLTLVLPRGPAIPDLVTSGLPSVGVRMPDHPAALALLREAAMPLAAPSANRFGRISPTCADDVFADLGERIPLVIDGGPCAVGVESTVLALEAHSAVLLRPGGVSRERIEEILGGTVGSPSSSLADGAQRAPGMLASHYAPRKPMRLLDAPLAVANFPAGLPNQVGVLARSGDAAHLAHMLEKRLNGHVCVEVLSASGNAAEAARNLFAALRTLDASEAELLFAEPWPDASGLGFAIQDRLKRASAD